MNDFPVEHSWKESYNPVYMHAVVSALMTREINNSKVVQCKSTRWFISKIYLVTTRGTDQCDHSMDEAGIFQKKGGEVTLCQSEGNSLYCHVVYPTFFRLFA